jgi:hypothetical protein
VRKAGKRGGGEAGRKDSKTDLQPDPQYGSTSST